jgi:hypothetical protein
MNKNSEALLYTCLILLSLYGYASIMDRITRLGYEYHDINSKGQSQLPKED